LVKRIVRFLATAALLAVAVPSANAQQMNFIRDAECENIMRFYAAPIFRAGGFDPKAIQIHLIADRSLNAFVSNGLNIYFFTGLIMRADNAEQVMGVMAHELGHIVGGHLARMDEKMRQAQKQSIYAMALGALAAVATGNPGAAPAAILGGQQAVMASVLSYSRTQESSADQAGLKYLDEAGISAQGLYDFFKILEGQELLAVGRQDPYMRTHPLTPERMAAVQAHLAKSPFTNKPLPPIYAVMHNRMKAKLAGFMDPPASVMKRYPETDNSIDARYARAIVYYRVPDLQKAIPLIDGLIAEEPKNPYFHELKGQMLFENGRAAEAIQYYQQAVDALPDNGLLRTELAQAQIESQDLNLNKAAIANLEKAREFDDDNAQTYRLLATAYGRDGQVGMAALIQADLALGYGRNGEARILADRAMQNLRQGSPAWQRANDIKHAAETEQQ
jgi:predicted Zn-dependent protease